MAKRRGRGRRRGPLAALGHGLLCAVDALCEGVGAAFAALVESTGCEYLYLDKVDDLFRESYGGLFSDGLADAEQGETLVYHVDSLGHYSPVEMEVP